MKRLAAVLALLALAACSAPPKVVEGPPAADPATLRTVSGGQLVGFTDKASGAQVWRDIPFAAPPVGPLRWRAPRPAAAWTGQRVSTAQAPWCPQQLSALDGAPKADWGKVVGQEDCLYLNIYAPPMDAAAASPAKLPVMVWIHGGSNTWGRAQQYDGGALAARFKVVVVVIQYRLGALGWMSSAALREGGTIPEDASSNFGTLDQIRALEWVKQDIGAFGGDNSRVTIFGESAGGQNVAALLASPRAKGLFQRAIVESGGFDSTPVFEAETSDEHSGDRMAPLIVGKGRSVTGETLRAAPLQSVFAAYNSKDYQPVRLIDDGIVLPAEGIRVATAKAATFNAVPVITGTNHDELKLYGALNPKLVNFLFGKLPMIKDKALYEAASAYPTRMWRVNAVVRPAQAMAEGGHAAVWTYRFDWDEEGKVLGVDLGQLLGAGHSLEIPFVFGHWNLLGSFDKVAFTKDNAASRIALSDAMMSYWVQFARTGDPGRGVDGKLPLWSPWRIDAAAPRTMLFDTPAGGGVRMAAEADNGERVTDELLADPAFKTEAQRCELTDWLARDNPDIQGLKGRYCKIPTHPLKWVVPVCRDAAGHAATCQHSDEDGAAPEYHECVAADGFDRCPGDPLCFDAGGRQVVCKRPVALTAARLEPRSWQPDAGQVAKLEAALALPDKAHTPADYERFYTGGYIGDRKVIVGVWLGRYFPRKPGAPAGLAPASIHLRPDFASLPFINDGGCLMIRVVFDAETGRPVSARCNHAY